MVACVWQRESTAANDLFRSHIISARWITLLTSNSRHRIGLLYCSVFITYRSISHSSQWNQFNIRCPSLAVYRISACNGAVGLFSCCWNFLNIPLKLSSWRRDNSRDSEAVLSFLRRSSRSLLDSCGSEIANLFLGPDARCTITLHVFFSETVGDQTPHPNVH